ncbi:MAG: capsular biosynthesis protein [Granulosicoccus sp.]|nr:capsular biosynthesis protein [Granulosicoccus sp.]
MRRNVLLLQGPIGPFFSRFADDLEERGFKVTKINFNGGDRFFYQRPGAIDFTGKLENWESWLERLMVNRDIGRIYLFGDCRSYHRIAREVAMRLDARVFVFEEGYIRPNFITLEENGVNGHSTMMNGNLNIRVNVSELPEEYQQPGNVFQLTALYSILYYWASAARKSRFAHYRHHRPLEWFSEGSRWIYSGYRKWRYSRRERDVLNELIPQFNQNYFVCPLQVHCDMQVVVHSDFNSIEHFVGDVLASFSEHAPSNKAIVFKHHPLDRGYTDYSTLLANMVAELGLQGRVYYVHDVCLPTLLRHAQGTVLINSTVGISSLFHGTPVKTLGDAVYDIPGLTAQTSLDEFWRCERFVDKAFFQAFRDHLVQHNQLNGNLYRRISNHGATGIVWSDQLSGEHIWDADRVEQVGAPKLTVINGGAGSARGPERDSGAEAA